MRRLLLLSGLFLLVAACGSGGSASPTANSAATATRGAELTQVAAALAPTNTVIAPTNTAVPTATSTETPAPTNTPVPTATPKPTVTVPPTRTPKPTSTPRPTSTPLPPPTPTFTVEQAKAQYRSDIDVRDLDKNIDAYHDWKLHYEGTVLTIQQDDTSTFIQLQVLYPDGSDYDRVTIIVLYDDPHAGDGIYEKDTIGIWGYPIKMFTFTNSLGGQVSQPLLGGDYIEKIG